MQTSVQVAAGVGKEMHMDHCSLEMQHFAKSAEKNLSFHIEESDVMLAANYMKLTPQWYHASSAHTDSLTLRCYDVIKVITCCYNL